MAFQYPRGKSGVQVNGRDLMEFSCKLQSAYSLGASQVETETFQGRNRSTLLLLSQSYGTLEIKLPLEFWGESRADTVEKWTEFCRTLTGSAELDLGDGFLYACVATDLGTPVWITDEWMAADVTLQAMRQRAQITVTADTDIGSAVYCQSTFPRTDCVITLPGALLGGAKVVSVQLGDNTWYLEGPFDGQEELVLDGVHKVFLQNGENITAQIQWEDFPYLVPGRNSVGVYVDGIGVTQGLELSYRPTFL